MKRRSLNLLGTLALCSALNLPFSIAFAQFVTITNPTPAASDWFGQSVAGVGADRVLIGAPGDSTGAFGVGVAYLFSTNGALLTTFTNPTPAYSDDFGHCLAAVGTERVLIGAPGDNSGATEAGAAYLFSTNGELVTTFTNPTPQNYDRFGVDVAVVGSERVLIGALNDNTGATGAGAAYLFNTNAVLLATFTNPTPADWDYFGYFVTAVGGDSVLIGTPSDDTGERNAGAAYLFSTSGALLTTFTNPTPTASGFGLSVAAVGMDRVLIGSPRDDAGAIHAGVAYLFSTNGALLTTFTNPTPASYDEFGASVAAVGSDRVLIAAHYDDTGGFNAGAVYLFSTDGALLATFVKPTPASSDSGMSMAAVETNWVLIGTIADPSGTFSGVVYQFSIVQTPGAPSLTIRLTITNTVTVSWPSPLTDWTLQENTNGVASVNWSNAPGTIQDDGTNKTLIVNPPIGERFYRLFKP